MSLPLENSNCVARLDRTMDDSTEQGAASEQLRRWTERWPDHAREFRGSLTFRHDDGVEHWWAIGRAAEIRVDIDGRALYFEFRRDGQVRFDAELRYRGGQTPYSLMFEYLSEFQRRAAAVMQSETADEITCLGGWKAVPRVGARQELARFTFPRSWERRMDSPERKLANEQAVRPESTLNHGEYAAARMQARLESHLPERPRYVDDLADLLAELRLDARRKVVVARMIRARLSQPFEPVDLLQRLELHGYDEVYSYLFQWEGNEAWVGISPETLVRMRDRRYQATVLAGTRKKRGETSEREETGREELLTDAKEDLEHRTAVELMWNDLTAVSRPGSVRCAGRRVSSLKYANHLKTEITGVAKEDVGIFELLGSIYPPATIWGTPRSWAGERIASLESFAREYYSGGLGYVTADGQANFALAIRTAVLRGDVLDMFAGSGIVAGADPGREWNETATKMSPFLSLLDADGNSR